MSYYTHWQPLKDENAHTALAFGFLRHVPVEHGLNAWLSEVLERPATATPLAAEDFWPRYSSSVAGSVWTEPELVFDADDGDALKIIIEAKPGYGQQRCEQVAREVIDTARAEGAARVACIMVGADLGAPMPLEAWAAYVRRELSRHDLDGVACEILYTSWASLGRVAERSAAASPAWESYANDVLEQLRLNVLMGYDGAPVLDGLEGGLTIANAAEAFNLTIGAARQFFLALHTATGYVALGLEPYGGRHRILRDGLSDSPTGASDYFETTVLLSLYRKALWAPEQVVFVSFDLSSGPEPELQAGAGVVAKDGETMVYRWAHSDEPDGSLRTDALAGASKEHFPYAALYDPGAEWSYDGQPWLPRRPDADLAWAIDKLGAACAIWDGA